MLVAHAVLVMTGLGTLLTGIAATVNAVRGRKVSERNEQAILVVHDLVNGRYAATVEELARANKRVAELESQWRKDL